MTPSPVPAQRRKRVLELNKADGGDRKFILVECEKYADKITAERVRRVIKGVPKAKTPTSKKDSAVRSPFAHSLSDGLGKSD